MIIIAVIVYFRSKMFFLLQQYHYYFFGTVRNCSRNNMMQLEDVLVTGDDSKLGGASFLLSAPSVRPLLIKNKNKINVNCHLSGTCRKPHWPQCHSRK